MAHTESPPNGTMADLAGKPVANGIASVPVVDDPSRPAKLLQAVSVPQQPNTCTPRRRTRATVRHDSRAQVRATAWAAGYTFSGFVTLSVLTCRLAPVIAECPLESSRAPSLALGA